MQTLSVHRLLTLAVGLGVGSAQAPAPAGGRGAGAAESQSAAPIRIVKNDPALDEIIAPGARLETVVEHVGLT